MMHYLLSASVVLMVLMLIDCALNRRDLYWFFIIIILGPFGGPAYLLYNWNTVTFPFPVARTFANLKRPGAAGKTCSRCFRRVNRLEPFEDGRSVQYICRMCKAEMEILRSKDLRPE